MSVGSFAEDIFIIRELVPEQSQCKTELINLHNVTVYEAFTIHTADCLVDCKSFKLKPNTYQFDRPALGCGRRWMALDQSQWGDELGQQDELRLRRVLDSTGWRSLQARCCWAELRRSRKENVYTKTKKINDLLFTLRSRMTKQTIKAELVTLCWTLSYLTLLGSCRKCFTFVLPPKPRQVTGIKMREVLYLPWCSEIWNNCGKIFQHLKVGWRTIQKWYSRLHAVYFIKTYL